MSARVPESLDRTARLVQPALHAAVGRLEHEQMRRIAGYQLGWSEADGSPTDSHGGKGIRGALAVLTTEAIGADGTAALPAAVAVELVHNFSLLHDDVMDRDVERRHRPTGWVVFGDGPTILAGTAMLTLAVQVVREAAPAALPCLLDATQQLIAGQADDLQLESASDVQVDEVLAMSAGKTAALLACAASIGPAAVRAPAGTVDALAGYGYELGMAFQLVDDILGITGDPEATGKSASSDLRAGKRSVPVVAALSADNDAARRLREMLAAGPPQSDDDVAIAAKLVDEAGGIDWTRQEAEARMARAMDHLAAAPLLPELTVDLAALGRYVVERDR